MIKQKEILAVHQEVTTVYSRLDGSRFILKEILEKNPKLKDLVLWRSKFGRSDVTLEKYVKELDATQQQLSKCSRALYALVHSAPKADSLSVDIHAILDELVSRYDEITSKYGL